MANGIILDAATRWSRYRIGYHLVWTPKFRHRILTEEVADTAKAAIAKACEIAGMRLLAVETDQDHVHVFISADPATSPADIARILKGASSREIRKQHPEVARASGPRGLWSQSYYVGTVGDMSAETVRHYIENCQGR